MFGYPCAFVNGNMFTGLHEHRMVVRLPEEQREALLRVPGATRFEPMKGRVMREYVVVPDRVLASKRSLRPWVRKAFDYAASLAAKKPKRPRPAAPRKTKGGVR
jgi:TfoX/Sxy family transcriptional regulator of competence genes